MNAYSRNLPEGFSLFDVHVHLGTFENQQVFPAFYLDELCSAFPIEYFVWAPFSWDESHRFLKSPKDATLPARLQSQALKWLWISPVREDGLTLLNKDRCPTGYAGIKLHPYADHYDLANTIIRPVVEAAERWQVPVAIHTGNRGCAAGLVSSCFPETFASPLILFHARPFDEAVAVARRLTSVHLELSFASGEDLSHAYEAIGPDRIIFGSDYPVAALYYQGIDVLRHYGRYLFDLLEISERLGISSQFFSKNAKRLFSLSLQEANS